MEEIKIAYAGELRCQATNNFGGMFITDAPKKYGGKEEAFSPTGALVASLGACILTIMDLVAQKHNISIAGTTVDAAEEMASKPSARIAKIFLTFHMARNIPEDKRPLLENVVRACPVHNSLSSEIVYETKFVYPD